jgi:hypothetical protein
MVGYFQYERAVVEDSEMVRLPENAFVCASGPTSDGKLVVWIAYELHPNEVKDDDVVVNA